LLAHDPKDSVSDVVLTVSKGCVSMMAGNRRGNTNKLKEVYELRSVKIVESEEMTSDMTGQVKIRIVKDGEKGYNAF